MNLWTGTLLDVSCSYLQKHGKPEIFAACLTNWINEFDCLLFDMPQIQHLKMSQPVVVEGIPPAIPVQIPAQIDHEPNSYDSIQPNKVD